MQKRGMGVSDERALWLATHVMPHEPAVRGWLRRGRQAEFDVDDIIQEAYAKLVTVADVSEIRNVRAYFFRTAYSVLVSRVRRKSVVSIRSLAEVESLQLAVDELTPEDTVMARNELQVLAEMISRLPEKTRKIFLLSRVSGLSQKEVSRRTGIAESTVEKHIAKGLGLLMAAYANGGFGAVVASKSEKQQRGKVHGQADKPGG
ncbi:RNA polymerase sigma factor [Brevundimonas sp. P7753]|jgi:RNA polymerase sigma factor (sigma-70 family)|uniref:RNA polymerase sigma factor n=2 Tax=Brevundimonas TaxID=41275 RepID=UPI0015C09EB3|nr:sigma-70 family RNA polymerase sigma factor [Brevundimonas sp. P7753]NWE52129.1 sigma-70 family RNA polymerase sigma factor [Brevundimonas sp. P7753]